MSKASQPTDKEPIIETKILARWECPCGMSVLRERFRDDVPTHHHCGDMTYIEDVEIEIER